MTRLTLSLAVGVALTGTAGILAAAEARSGKSDPFNPTVASYVSERIAEFDRIPEERKSLLKKAAGYVRSRTDAGRTAKLVFICTHNSRRSHMSQIWASAAASYFGVAPVECFSGGTEGTAFNPRAVAALRRAGMKIEKTSDDKNPRYLIHLVNGVEPLACFSKRYNDAANPSSEFCAVMTCSEADKACPTVEGAALRLAIPYQDPKVADGKPEEVDEYDERCAQISREMFYLFSQVKP